MEEEGATVAEGGGRGVGVVEEASREVSMEGMVGEEGVSVVAVTAAATEAGEEGATVAGEASQEVSMEGVEGVSVVAVTAAATEAEEEVTVGWVRE